MAAAPRNLKILVNSMPKSGTHLATKAVECLGFVSYQRSQPFLRRMLDRTPWGSPLGLTRRFVAPKTGQAWRPGETMDGIPIGILSPVYVAPDAVHSRLTHVRPGCYITGHVPYSRCLSRLFHEDRWKVVTILRDPRAVVSSYLPYVLRSAKRDHPLKRDFETLSQQERFHLILYGGYLPLAKRHNRGLLEAYSSVLGWRESQDAFVLRFEDLVGPQGGGSASAQETAVRDLADFLQVDFDAAARTQLTTLFDPSSSTFRFGQINTWRDDFNAEHIQQLESILGPLLDELGYVRSCEGKPDAPR